MSALVTTLLFLVLIGVGAMVSVRYRRDLRAARARVRATSRTVQTAAGSIEYALVGEGSGVGG